MHQGAEYLVGLVLVASGVQSPDPLYPLLAGGLVVLNAAITAGPLGAFRLVSRRQHRILDLVVIGIIAVAAVLPFLAIDGMGRASMLLVAAVLGVLWYGTNFETRAAASRRRSGARAALASDRSEAIGRSAGRLFARAAAEARRRQRS